MVTIRDYARNNGVSYETVRYQVNRYKEELEGHITIQGRTTYLDEEAVTFLNGHRAPKTVIIEPSEDEVKAEIESLKEQIMALQRENSKQKDVIIQLQAEKLEFKDAMIDHGRLLEDHTRTVQELERSHQKEEEQRLTIKEQEEKLLEAEKERDQVKTELDQEEQKRKQVEQEREQLLNELDQAKKENESYIPLFGRLRLKVR